MGWEFDDSHAYREPAKPEMGDYSRIPELQIVPVTKQPPSLPPGIVGNGTNYNRLPDIRKPRLPYIN